MTKEKTIMQALTEVVPNYLASYICWYYLLFMYRL